MPYTTAKRYTQPLIEALAFNADKEIAASVEKYLKNKFVCYGMKTDTRRAVFKEFCKIAEPLNWPQTKQVALYLWALPHRECHYCAIEFLNFYKKQFDEDFLQIIEKLIVENSWWDTVDGVNSMLIKNYYKKFPAALIVQASEWNLSENIWLQRISIIYQLKQKDETNEHILAKHILNCAHSKEFFVQKASGWALREYAYTNAEGVKIFVSKNNLPPLTKREALKKLLVL